MLTVNNGRKFDDGTVEPRHTITQVCANCGYDLTEEELAADTCADCGKPLNLKTSVAIVAASLPMSGGVM